MKGLSVVGKVFLLIIFQPKRGEKRDSTIPCHFVKFDMTRQKKNSYHTSFLLKKQVREADRAGGKVV